jgi:hypothetical protein
LKGQFCFERFCLSPSKTYMIFEETLQVWEPKYDADFEIDFVDPDTQEVAPLGNVVRIKESNSAPQTFVIVNDCLKTPNFVFSKEDDDFTILNNSYEKKVTILVRYVQDGKVVESRKTLEMNGTPGCSWRND